jgi:hypothetical protein
MARRRRSNFVPWRVSNLVVYLDAESSPVTFGADTNVSQLDDISQEGSANNGTQGTAAKQPNRDTGIQNGKAALTFTQANADHLGISSSDISGGQFTLFAVLNTAQAVNNETVCDDSNNHIYYVYYNGSPRDILGRIQVSSSNKTVTSGGDEVAVGTPHISAFRYDQTNLELFGNGSSTGTTAETGTPDALGATLYLGNVNSTATADCMYRIHAFLGFSVAVSDDDVTKIFNYLNLRWAVY